MFLQYEMNKSSLVIHLYKQLLYRAKAVGNDLHYSSLLQLKKSLTEHMLLFNHYVAL